MRLETWEDLKLRVEGERRVSQSISALISRPGRLHTLSQPRQSADKLESWSRINKNIQKRITNKDLLKITEKVWTSKVERHWQSFQRWWRHHYQKWWWKTMNLRLRIQILMRIKWPILPIIRETVENYAKKNHNPIIQSNHINGPESNGNCGIFIDLTIS